jgi:hypothetical protein
MTILSVTRPNWIVPLFRQTGYVIEYKRFPADYRWREFLDLSEIDTRITAIEANLPANLAATLATMTAATATAQARANEGVANAATAQSTANAANTNASTANANAADAQATADNAVSAAAAAQSTANSALSTANAALPTSSIANYLPNRFAIFSDELIPITGTNQRFLDATNYPYGTINLINSSTGEYQFQVCVQAGTYTIHILYQRANNRAKMRLYHDATALGSEIEGYNSTPIYVNEAVQTGISIPVNGVYLFRFIVTGRNASNTTAYYFGAYKIWGERTA